jgi:hypothetical protein
MYFITDANGGRLTVEDVNNSLSQVNVFLTDAELLPAMTAEEIMYYQDLKEKLLQLQLTEGTGQ